MQMIDDADVRAQAALVRAHREKLLRDPHRPGYHFAIPEGAATPFDPNGAVFWKGRYHLFYIYQTGIPGALDHHWGHVSSTDLFHWRHHPTGLVSGMFSGNCLIDKGGTPCMCYHQVRSGNSMAIAGDDDLNTWKKLGPITPATKPGDAFHDRYRSWDPFAWLEGDTYYAIFGGKRPGVAKAADLAGPWQYTGDLFAHGVAGVTLDEDVSCADLFRLGGKDVLLCISHSLGCRYYVGEWRDEQFHPERHEQMSWVDNAFFAPESLIDDRGRRIMWAWILDGTGFKARPGAAWSGTMSLPRVLTLGDDHRLRMAVPEEIEALRYNPRVQSDIAVEADSEVRVADVAGRSLELAIDVNASNATRFGIKVCCSPNGEEETLIYYDAEAATLNIDTGKSSTGDELKRIEAGPFALDDDEPLRLRVFVDKSVVEAFANERQAVARRIYPARADSTGVGLFAQGGAATIARFQAWDMMPANPY